MLFSSEIDSLHDDYFEGSINEHHICKKVYFGNDGGRGTKRCVVTGVINFEHDSSKHADIPLCSNSGNSAITSQEDLFEIKEGPREKSEHLHISEQYEWAMRDNSDVKVKRMKLSIDNPSNGMSYLHNGFNSTAPLKCVVSDAPQSALGFVTQSVTCRIVESARHGVSCSCYLLKKQSKMNLGGAIDGNDNCRYKLSSADVSEQKEVAASKAIASPVSQESSATKLLVASPAVVATDSGCHRPSKPRWKDACFIELDEAEMSLSRESKNDPRPLLRYHINRLLKAAGWVVGRRKRSNTYNGIGEYVYKSPEGRPIREFRRAWLLCGQTLLKASNTTYQENDVKQYVDLTQFWSDLNESTTKIEEMDDWETTSALAHCWYMLDPLAKVVFIDKLFSSLKAGKMVHARRSLVVKPKRASHAILAMQTVEKAGNLLGDEHVTDQPDESSLGLNQALVCFNEVNIMKQDQYFENMQAVPATAQRGATSIISQENAVRNIKCREISGTNRSGLDILYLQAYGSDSSSGQIGNDLFDVPINSQVANIYPGSETKKNKHLHGLNSKSITSEENLPVKCNSRGSGTKPRKYRMKDGNRQKKSSKCRLNDDDLLISAIVKNKSRKSTKKLSKVRKISLKSKTSKKNKNQRRNCRLLPRSFDRSGRHHIEGNCLPLGSRTVLSWLINSGVISLNEVIQYRNTKDDTVVKDGLVTWDGILCRCCDTVLSVSEFKSHAGFRLNRPCLNLFVESGKPFTLCQLEAWSAEYKARKSPARTVQIDESDENDDSCGLCGGEGELICCDNCPSTFHRACLYEQEIPEGNWYCSHCTCQICGDVVNNKDPLKSTNSLTCSQCEHKFHNVCVHKKGIKAVEPSDIWFCGEECYKVHSGLHSRVGLMNFMSDGFAWTLLRCMHGDKKVHSAQRFVALKAECNLKLAVALTIMEECFLPMVDARTGIDMIPHVLYNWGSHFARLNYHGFYTVVLEKNDVLLSVASIRIHGATVAEMPLIATCSKYRRQGMCRHLMNVIEEMLRSIKVEKLVMSAIPALVETWTEGFGFERLEDDERRGLRRTANLMVFPGTVWLKKSLNISQVSKQQHIGSCSASPSENDDLGQPSRKPEVCMSAEEFGVKTELIPSNDDIQTDNDLNGVELSSKTEPTPSNGSYILMDKDENEGVDLDIKAAPIPSNDNIEMDKDRNKGVELDTKTKTEIIDEDQNGGVDLDAKTELVPSNDNILIDKDQNESAEVDAKMELEPSDDSNILVDKDQNEGVEVDTKMELIPSDDNNMLIDKDQNEGVEHDVKKELIPSDGSNIQVYKDQNEDVEIHFSKLFSEEKEGNNHSEIRDVDSMEVYIEENIPDR